MKTQLSSKGQIVLPAELREADHLVAGQVFEICRLSPGEYLLKKSAQLGQPGLLQWLNSCPSHDWFEPVESESTDTLP